MSNCRAADVPHVFVIQAVCFILKWNSKTGIFFFPFHGGKLEIHTVKYRNENTEHLVDALTLRGLHFCLGGPAGKRKKKSANQRDRGNVYNCLPVFKRLHGSQTSLFHNSFGSCVRKLTTVALYCVCARRRCDSGLSDRIQSHLPSYVWTLRVCVSGVCLRHGGYYTWWIFTGRVAHVSPRTPPRGQRAVAVQQLRRFPPLRRRQSLRSHFLVWNDITHPTSSSALLCDSWDRFWL